ncbi:MAG: hypothetical protein CVU61_04255 [Deltaproteobacteria bacterium HGW-Deltaproteobacteria-19]|jgi:hypothetical protein|nr:MAG: hypothetical protein CVU61_04255 [Deltaproteobacteria bacterium HGW-Deltaproteobacteria-19]
MDRSFYEFWGRYFLALARGRQQYEDVTAWMRQGFQGSENLTEFFRKAYGLDREEKTDTADFWQQTHQSFLASFREYLALFDVVPREDLAALQRENDELKQTVVRLEDIIRRQQDFLGEKGLDPAGMVEGFQGLMQKQTDEFEKLMKSMGHYFDKKKKPLSS